MASSKEISTLIKVLNTIISWSGVPSDADDDDVIMAGDRSQDDITYGDLLELGNFARILREEIVAGKGVVHFEEEKQEAE